MKKAKAIGTIIVIISAIAFIWAMVSGSGYLLSMVGFLVGIGFFVAGRLKE